MRSGAFNAEWVLGGTTRLAIRIRVFSDKHSQLIKCIKTKNYYVSLPSPMFVNVLLFHLVQMYHLNSIHLLSLPYQFTCNLQRERLIVVFIISAHTPTRNHAFSLPRQSSIFCSQIENDFPELGSRKTRPLYLPSNCALATQSSSFVHLLPNLPPMPKKHAQSWLPSTPPFQQQTSQAINQN